MLPSSDTRALDLRESVERQRTNKVFAKQRTKYEPAGDMHEAITQRKAKVLIRDYLRETGRRGVTSLVKELRRHIGKPIFSQRTIEKWLEEQERMLQEENWQIVLSFVRSETFRKHVPYANEGPADDRLLKVAAGFVALYAEAKQPKGLHILPSVIEAEGAEAVKLLDGFWAHDPDGPPHRLILKMASVPGTRIAKFVVFAPLSRVAIPATGIVIYLNSHRRQSYDYVHTFVLQAWLRRNPEAGQNSRAELKHLTLARGQPEFCLMTGQRALFLSETAAARHRVKRAANVQEHPKLGLPLQKDEVLHRTNSPGDETSRMVDQLLEDVLPHGYA